ncbi:IclR family transcriptional regulator [Gordonia sp. N1V]|uniref:IclR family transcriptional regulator n=1 Tax=Gordonia sp. N1V TaxID=3034163 RepID=UPI0023E31F90|nr:IclR family transcriptional regulator [Gordonia sp. N1V]MDF3282988.1 IclR family transcriptional regulator [Gordonia sp. N1V]
MAAPHAGAAPSVLWKAFDVLNAFDRRRRILTLAQIVRHSGLPKSTVHRVLAMLVELGALEQQDDGYRIGLRMFSLGALPPEAALREAALVHLEELHRFTGHTLHLAVLRGSDVVYLEKLSTRKGVPTPAKVGNRLPAVCTAVGKAMLAHTDDAALGAVLEQPIPRLTRRSLFNAAQVIDQLAIIRDSGHALDREESSAGLACVGVPVLVNGSPVAAISVAFPAAAGNGDVLVRPLQQAAAAISRSPSLLGPGTMTTTG